MAFHQSERQVSCPNKATDRPTTVLPYTAVLTFPDRTQEYEKIQQTYLLV
jgi:hypothetical protein